MDIEPSQKTAALAGIWCVFGGIPFDHWLDQQHMGTLENNIAGLAAAAIFLFIPVIYFVIGRNNEPFSRTWFLDPEQRARYSVIAMRGLCWFFSAAVFGVIWSSLLSYVVWRT